MQRTDSFQKDSTVCSACYIRIYVIVLLSVNSNLEGARGGAVGWGTALQAGRSRVRFLMVSLEFFVDVIFLRPPYSPGVDSASNRNEYQEYFLGVKAAGA